MKNKVTLWILVIVLFFVFVIVYGMLRQNYREHHKNKIVFPTTVMALNTTSIHYLDTIAMVILNKEMGFDSLILIILPMPAMDFGDVSLAAYVDKDPQTPHKYWMHVDPKEARKDPYTLIAHECVHISQYEFGRLYPSTFGYGMIFDGYTYLYDKVPYAQRPFEISAYLLQTTYATQARHLIYDHK